MNEEEKKANAANDPIQNLQYIYQYKIQYIIPNTFSNKESIAQEDSLHNQLKNFISYPLIVWGGGGREGGGGGLLITTPHYSLAAPSCGESSRSRCRRCWSEGHVFTICSACHSDAWPFLILFFLAAIRRSLTHSNGSCQITKLNPFLVQTFCHLILFLFKAGATNCLLTPWRLRGFFPKSSKIITLPHWLRMDD